MGQLCSKEWVKSLLKKAKDGNKLGAGGITYSNEETAIGLWNEQVLYRIVNADTKIETISGTLTSVSSKELVIYTFTIPKDGIYSITNGYGYSQVSDSEGYFTFKIDGTQIAKFYITTGTTLASLISWENVVFAAKEGAVLTVTINWDGSHNTNNWGISGVINSVVQSDGISEIIKRDYLEFQKVYCTDYIKSTT